MEGDLAFRNLKPDYAFYAKKAAGKAVADDSAASVWRQLSLMGGERGYFYLHILWQLRGTLDLLIAGPGLCRRRPHPTELHLGDKVDFWLLTTDAFDQTRFARRTVEDFEGIPLQVSRPEDTILMKLNWAQLSGGSEKQFVDALRVYEALLPPDVD